MDTMAESTQNTAYQSTTFTNMETDTAADPSTVRWDVHDTAYHNTAYGTADMTTPPNTDTGHWDGNNTAYEDDHNESSSIDWDAKYKPKYNEPGKYLNAPHTDFSDIFNKQSTSQEPLFRHSASDMELFQSDTSQKPNNNDRDDYPPTSDHRFSVEGVVESGGRMDNTTHSEDESEHDSHANIHEDSTDSQNFPATSSSSRRQSSSSTHSLLSSGNIESLRHLVEIGAIDKLQQISANYNGTNGTSLLHRLAATRCTNIIHALLSHGCAAAAINEQDSRGQTPLHIAVACGLLQTVEILITFGADVNIADSQGRTPLQYCLSIDHEPIATDRTLTTLMLPTYDLSITDIEGISVLHYLSFWDLWAQLELGLGLRHTARVKDNRGRTPLHYCFMNPMLIALDAAFVLLKLDASLMCKDADGTTPLQRLIAHPLVPGNREVARFVHDFICHDLKDPNTGQNLLHISVVAGDHTTVQFLSQCGVDLNEVDPLDCTSPLHGAVTRNQTEMTRTLLQCGADPNVVDHLLQTPLHLAAIHARVSAAILILSTNGTDPNRGDERGRTPLHCAVHSGALDIVRQLLQHPLCNVNALDHSDSHAIHYAAAENKLKMVETLLLKGAKVNISDVEGRTPLHLAIATGNCDILRLLTLHGCSVNEYDKYGQTPLHMAAEIGNSDVVQTLMNRGANEKLRDSEGRRAEQVALETGSVRVMNVMKEHRDSMIMYSNENLVEDMEDGEEDDTGTEKPAAARSSSLPACVSNQTLDDGGIDECDDALINIQKKSNGSNGIDAGLKRFESDESKKKQLKCCTIL